MCIGLPNSHIFTKPHQPSEFDPSSPLFHDNCKFLCVGVEFVGFAGLPISGAQKGGRAKHRACA